MNKKIITIALTGVLALGLTACSQKAPANTANATTTTNAAQTVAEIKTMEGAELDKIMEDAKEKENYLVIDVRSKEDYDAGHVKYAINISVEDLEANLDKIASYKDKNVVTICNTGKKSQAAAEILVANGFTNVYNAQGVKDFTYTSIVTFENILASDLQAIADANDGTVTIVDVRDAKDYEAGHLQGAINIVAADFESQLNTIPTDKGVVTYCYSGNKSAAAAQALVDAGYTNVKNTLDGTKEHEYTFGN